jgi:hypothetical protein
VSIIISATGVGYVAMIVWLAIRRINRREWWTAPLALGFVIFPVLYVGSYIVLWPHIADGSPRGGPFESVKLVLLGFYLPLILVLDAGPSGIRDAVQWLMDSLK